MLFAYAALSELLYVAESALKRTLMLRLVAQFIFQVFVKRFEEGFLAFGGIFRPMKSDFRVDDRVCREANLPVEVDELFDEHCGTGAVRIVFGEPPVADGVVLFLRFVGKEFRGISAQTVFGGIFA